MANYRYKASEIEAMKKNILTHMEHETETKTAWRLRCAIEGQLMCCCLSKREATRLRRELTLYEKLTKNDLPDWQSEPIQPATPTETPQISTETAETVNVPVDGEDAVKSHEMQSREDVIAYLDKMHGVEYDAGEVVYLKDGYVAEEHTDEIEWCIYRNEDSDKCIETVRIAPQSPGTPQTAECIGEPSKLAQTA